MLALTLLPTLTALMKMRDSDGFGHVCDDDDGDLDTDADFEALGYER